jgi:hypothetical protein
LIGRIGSGESASAAQSTTTVKQALNDSIKTFFVDIHTRKSVSFYSFLRKPPIFK